MKPALLFWNFIQSKGTEDCIKIWHQFMNLSGLTSNHQAGKKGTMTQVTKLAPITFMDQTMNIQKENRSIIGVMMLKLSLHQRITAVNAFLFI